MSMTPNIQAHLDEMQKAVSLADRRKNARSRFDELEHLRSQHAATYDRFDLDRNGWTAQPRWDFSDYMDAAESIFIARQLEFIREELYHIEYPELKAKRLMPWNMSVDPGAEQFTARAIDLTGTTQLSKDQPDDVPMVELKVTSATADIYSMVLGYAYSDQEARNAMYARMPLPAMKAQGCREIMARKLDQIAWIGDTNSKTNGLATLNGNSVSVSTYTPAATDKSGTALWTNGKPTDDILADLNGAGNQILTNTNDTSAPDTWVLPITRYTLINTVRVGDGTSKTILKYFLKNNDLVKTIDRSPYLENGVTGSNWTGVTMLVYKNDRSKFDLLVPLEFEQKMPQFVGFKVKTFCHMRTGGIEVYVPKSICQMSNF